MASVRPKDTRPLVRFEGLPGEFSQHDFGEVDVHFQDGTVRRVHFFASRLKYSRWVQVSLVENQRVESLVRSLVEHFSAMGGVPLVAVFDRPTTIVHSWRRNGEVTQWNATFAQVVLELGIGVELCWPASGQQKGAVEKLVGWVKGSFFKQRRFLDEADLERQLGEWLVEVNTQRPSRATGVTHEARMRDERPRLRPVKVKPADLAIRVPVVVGPTGMVVDDTRAYSMPPDAIGLAGTLFLYPDRVRVLAGRHEAIHSRLREPNTRSVLPEHRKQMVDAVRGKRAKQYFKRQQLLQLGAGAEAFLTELVHRRPRVWLDDVEQLFEMLEEHGDAALRSALERALSAQTIGAEYVAHALGRSRRQVTA